MKTGSPAQGTGKSAPVVWPFEDAVGPAPGHSRHKTGLLARMRLFRKERGIRFMDLEGFDGAGREPNGHRCISESTHSLIGVELGKHIGRAFRGTPESLKNLLVSIALVCAGTALPLVAFEVALRATGFSYPSFWLPDEVTGSRLRPGIAGWPRSEGHAYVKINSRGLRDREHEVPKPEGVYRIAILGDSFAEAMQVGLEETFWWLLAQQLERCRFAGGRRVEAVNFGASGYGTAQQLLVLRSRAWEYAPDMVLLAFFPGNDVRNNSKALEREKNRPFFVLRAGLLELDDSFLSDPAFKASRRAARTRAALRDLRLYQMLRLVKAGRPAVRHNAPIAVALAEGGTAPPALSEPGLDENVLREPPDAAWQEAWVITEELLGRIHEETRARGARFAVAVLSTSGAVHPDAGLRKRYAEYLGVADLFYPERRLLEAGERRGFEVIALAPQMQRHAAATGSHLHGFANSKLGFGHWNQAGHHLGAALIAQRLCGKAAAAIAP